MSIRTPNSWTKLVTALALSCAAFSFGAAAQNDSGKPLDKRAVAALVAELREVVARTSPDAGDAATVAEKWGKRADLVGKSRKDIIDLLYADAKSVIKDSGVLYQIYAMFSFYKRIPGEMQPVRIGETIPPTSKAASVKTLIDLTFLMHPYVGIDEQLASLPGTKDIKAEEESAGKQRIEGFEAALKINKKLTPDQKAFVRANYDRLLKIADKITEDAIRKNFPTERWIREGLQKSYTAKFTHREINELIVYFQGADGQPVLKYIRISQMAQMITGNGGTLNFTAADKSEHDKFAATPLGKKFIAAYLREAVAYEQRMENAVRSKNPDADGFAIYETENLNKLFNQFVAENYKK